MLLQLVLLTIQTNQYLVIVIKSQLDRFIQGTRYTIMNSDRNNACATPPKPTSGALIITGSIYWKPKDIFKCSVGNGGHASFHYVRDR